MKIQTSQFGEVHVLTNCPLLNSTERLEWMTEVHESFDGNEERYPLRDVPRRGHRRRTGRQTESPKQS